jgi:hypothetical protein
VLYWKGKELISIFTEQFMECLLIHVIKVYGGEWKVYEGKVRQISQATKTRREVEI